MTRITSKGQVTIPLEFRQRFGLLPGQEVEFVEEDGRVVVRRRVEHAHLDGWFGCLTDIDDVDEFVRDLRDQE